MKLILEHGTNVDLMHGQGDGTGYWTPPRCPEHQEVDVPDLKSASVRFRMWIAETGLGGGNMTKESGKVFDGDQVVARVSYNGRVWDAEDKEILV